MFFLNIPEHPGNINSCKSIVAKPPLMNRPITQKKQKIIAKSDFSGLWNRSFANFVASS